jgi:hypothetical protein
MNKYLISIASELDGHAGAISCYVQTETPMTRAQFLLQLIRLFGPSDDNINIAFEESVFSLKRKSSGQYNGDIVFTYKKENFISRIPISVLVTILPPRMTKDKLYIIESRTG